MKKLFLAAALAAVTSAAIACDDNSRCATVIKTSDGFTNLRTGPTTKSNIIMPLKSGTPVVFDEVVNGWAHVSYLIDIGDGNTQGWINHKYLKQGTCSE